MTTESESSKLPRKFNFEFWLPVVLGIAAVTWFLVLPSWRNVSGHWSVSAWSETDGRVSTSESYWVESQQSRKKKYRFRYRFEVDGIEFENSRYSFRYASGDQMQAVERHNSGDTVVVYFDPEDPSQSVIVRDSNPWWNYVVLGTLVIVPIAFFIRLKTLHRTVG